MRIVVLVVFREIEFEYKNENVLKAVTSLIFIITHKLSNFMVKEEKHEENALNVSSRKKYSFIINLNMSISVS